jgi:hypothetical protein
MTNKTVKGDILFSFLSSILWLEWYSNNSALKGLNTAVNYVRVMQLVIVVNKLKDISCNEALDYIHGTVAHTLNMMHYFYHTFPTIIHELMMKHKREGGSIV